MHVMDDTGSVWAQGVAEMNIYETTCESWAMKNTSAVGLDTKSTEQMLILSVEFSQADTGNSITCTNFIVESVI